MTKLTCHCDGDCWSNRDLAISVNLTRFFERKGTAFSVVVNGENAGATDGYAAIVIKTFETKEAARTFAAKLANLINEKN